MDKTFAIIIIVLVILVLVVYIVMLKIKTSKKNGKEMLCKDEINDITLSNFDLSCLELKPVVSNINENELIEIKDKNLLAKIDNIIPNTFNAISNVEVSSKIQNMSSRLLESNIPIEQLAKSGLDPNAMRGFVKDGNKIIEHANFTSVADKAKDMSRVANINAIMNVGSMVVGQYYMAEISNKLDLMKDGIETIADFQENDYKARVLQVILDTMDLSEFQCDIVENEDVRNLKLTSLEIDNKECKKLIGLANESIKTILKKDSKNNKDYIDNMKNLEKWYKYQYLMLQILEQMSLLYYSLNTGRVKKIQAYKGFYKYQKMSNDINLQIKNWHEKQQKKLEYKLEDGLRKEEGFHWFLSQLNPRNKNKGYRKIDKNTKDMIQAQMNNSNDFVEDKRELYDKDIKIIKKDDKYYFLPQ